MFAFWGQFAYSDIVFSVNGPVSTIITSGVVEAILGRSCSLVSLTPSTL